MKKKEKKIYKSKAKEAIHETAKSLHDVGLLDETTMKEFDEGCLTKEAQIKEKLERIAWLKKKIADLDSARIPCYKYGADIAGNNMTKELSKYNEELYDLVHEKMIGE